MAEPSLVLCLAYKSPVSVAYGACFKKRFDICQKTFVLALAFCIENVI